MRKIGKILPIRFEFSKTKQETMQTSLAKHGFSRSPGTGEFKFPYKELDGTYRTGLDPNAAYIKRIQNKTAQEMEIKRVEEMRDLIQASFPNLDLSPRSKFWDFSKGKDVEDTDYVSPVKLMDGENIFDLSLPRQALQFAWLRVHPVIASSLQAFQRGDYPSDTKWYVADEELEDTMAYTKKMEINKAIVLLSDMAPTKRIKVARLLGLPISDDAKIEHVYNLIDNKLKETEFSEGKYRGLSPVKIFIQFATLDDNILNVKDLVKQALLHSIYRVKPNGKVLKGDTEMAKDEEELVKYLADDDNQEDLLMLEQELKGKKLAAV